MPTIEVCFSPNLLSLHNLNDKIVVVVDILRATSCMVTALACGVESILPLQDVETCKSMQLQGYLVAAERDGKKVEGFDLGNSPFSYMDSHLQGKKIAFTTTNGTQVIKLSESAKQIVVGAFLNLSAIANYLKKQQGDVLIACAGWKGQVNVEDTLFAGALVQELSQEFSTANDSALLAQSLYLTHQGNLLAFVSLCSHVQRLKNLGIQKDIEFCLQKNVYEIVPILQNGSLVKLTSQVAI
ncbi:2-phosphosulfolactate phosphatase [Raineya orbicola]|jgi:2-phosphosulfolactate phosphatase|uniref:Probable 2-phosphosulfolactate phosphatase n=1 Tax=Raineya orbicola TaxID=2016530 RepID=A0A2N3ID93_9BACT|nr:2-phosphosulfolactate phosphatase [Raineya orbicola]PKQ68276.1 Phosphosulfolactate phosphohydrolase [Raineya orbicola]